MALDYYIYSTKTGDLISKTRYAGMPFLWSDATPYTHTCVVKGDLGHLDEWTTDENSELWQSEFNKEPWYREDDLLLYCSKEDIINLQKLMTCNETVLEELMNEYKSDGLIVRIF